jgi:hypothetical protein
LPAWRIETCIAGLYWLQSDDAVIRLSGGNAKALQRFLGYIGDSDPITTPDVIDDLTSAFGNRRDLPTLRSMAEAVAAATGEPFALDLYTRMYVPLSTFFSHPTGLALLRHVRRNNHLGGGG